VNLGFNPRPPDRRGRMAVHFACVGGILDIIRELDNLGVVWTHASRDGTPAELAARFGRLPVLQWLWTKGALLADPVVGWVDDRGFDDPRILRWAAEGGTSGC
jgi:hypothetical protein